MAGEISPRQWVVHGTPDSRLAFVVVSAVVDTRVVEGVMGPKVRPGMFDGGGSVRAISTGCGLRRNGKAPT